MLVVFIIVVSLCKSADCKGDHEVIADRCVVKSSGIILKLWPSAGLGEPYYSERLLVAD
jgi:hypothetical protein